VGRIKGYSHGKSTQRELDNSSKTNHTRAKGSAPEKAQQVKKELINLSPVDVAEGT
jgi:hypothetical protein